MGSKMIMENAEAFFGIPSMIDGNAEPIKVTIEAQDICITKDDSILQEIREICSGLALSDRARALRYDKIVEVLNG